MLTPDKCVCFERYALRKTIADFVLVYQEMTRIFDQPPLQLHP
jgi:hypothetical protein